ncbi:MAG: hypothetical protein AB8B52_07435 [Winogradskyella sp.]|uniref:hypothetical protein n=1 Tax=Winogradskyella sp. TaxID=1883156 RepID=UPI00385FFD27
MKGSKILIYAVAFLLSLFAEAQTKEIKGQLIADDEVEGLHILNKTNIKYTISNEGGSFVIPASVSDTLVISGVKYKLQEVIISAAMMEAEKVRVTLVEDVNELREVVVGKILTGSLESDLENSDAEPEINFYDLGIPGYTGKQLTQNERKLFDADSGPNGFIGGGPFGAGAGVNLHKLLNKVTGRTKKLKAIVELDNRDACIQRLKNNYESLIFENDTLAENLKTEYYLFCQEDDDFLTLCQQNNDIKLIEFLQAKLLIYRENLNSVKD